MNEFKTIEQIIDDLSFKNDSHLTFTDIEKEQGYLISLEYTFLPTQ